ncbi:MAG: ATP-NAD kinase family protein [Deltaproteobacteria bacterium]|nr:ATP-NAD kinase family protein [Deltaproteobacteria bacterium]
MDATKRKRLGLIVNPIAGIGGRVGLKGSDGSEILKRAREMGARPEAPARTVVALERIAPDKDQIELVTPPHEMGEDEARACGFDPRVIGEIETGKTTAGDTKRAARKMVDLSVDLLLFAGGDGTARDIYSAIGTSIPSLGIPCGVKIHSGVFATSPGKAGELARDHLCGKLVNTSLREAEVMDIDEEAFREDRVSARLYGYLKIPFEKRMVQSPKAGGCAGERAQLEEIAWEVINNMEDECIYIIGTGTTTRTVMEKLGLKSTLLGVDAVCNRKLLGLDLNESQILDMIQGKRAKIFVGIIGRQGYIFGRGNQQISPLVIKMVGRDNIIVLGTMEKIASLGGEPLRVDTGDREVDKMLSGYVQVVTGFRERVVLTVE